MSEDVQRYETPPGYARLYVEIDGEDGKIASVVTVGRVYGTVNVKHTAIHDDEVFADPGTNLRPTPEQRVEVVLEGKVMHTPEDPAAFTIALGRDKAPFVLLRRTDAQTIFSAAVSALSMLAGAVLPVLHRMGLVDDDGKML